MFGCPLPYANDPKRNEKHGDPLEPHLFGPLLDFLRFGLALNTSEEGGVVHEQGMVCWSVHLCLIISYFHLYFMA